MITYKTGDATNPEELKSGQVLLIHITNTHGTMGAGIAAAIAKKWPNVDEKYVEFCNNERFHLGDVQFVKAEKDFFIGNMFAQKDFGVNEFGMPAIRYEALLECLYRVDKAVKQAKKPIKVVGPRFGCGLAKGEWESVFQLIKKVGLDITIYDLPVKR